MLPTGSTTDLRRHNRDAVLRAIKSHGAISRTEIADHVGLTNAAVSRITKQLICAGLVEEGERIELKGHAGRRQVSLEMARDGAFVLGFAITLNAREVVIADGHGTIFDRVDCSDVSLRKPDPALQEFASRAKRLVKRAGIDSRRLLGSAASVAGRVDPLDGRITGAGPLDWDGQRVAAKLEALTGLNCVSEGRAAALLRAEHQQGQANGITDILLVNVGLKIGTACMVDGHLLRGSASNACLLGRYRISQTTCLDDVASGFAVLAQLNCAARASTTQRDPGRRLREFAEQSATPGNNFAGAFRRAGRALGKALDRLTPVLSPQLIILAGLVGRQEAYLDGAKSVLDSSIMPLRTSRLTTSETAIWLALETYLFSHDLDIDSLMAA
ncbi:MAG: ROK family transcriptional regulator [Hyphomicrobiaceae bacterium]